MYPTGLITRSDDGYIGTRDGVIRVFSDMASHDRPGEA